VTSQDDDKFPPYLQQQSDRFLENLGRVENLIKIYDFLNKLVETEEGDHPDTRDVLRSAVVMIHASLEDFLRSMASAHIPRSHSQLLERIPLVGKLRSGKSRGSTLDT